MKNEEKVIPIHCDYSELVDYQDLNDNLIPEDGYPKKDLIKNEQLSLL